MDIYYSTSSDSSISSFAEGFWTGLNGGLIAENISTIAGLNSYEWDLSGFPVSDSVRIRIVSDEKVVLDEKTDQYVKARDINGWYIKVQDPSMIQLTSNSNQYFIGPQNLRGESIRK